MTKIGPSNPIILQQYWLITSNSSLKRTAHSRFKAFNGACETLDQGAFTIFVFPCDHDSVCGLHPGLLIARLSIKSRLREMRKRVGNFEDFDEFNFTEIPQEPRNPGKDRHFPRVCSFSFIRIFHKQHD